MKVVLALAAGVFLAAFILVVGPKETTLCESTGWPNSLFGDTFGHTDGASFTGCDVPTGASWALAGAALVAPVAAAVAVAVDRRERP